MDLRSPTDGRSAGLAAIFNADDTLEFIDPPWRRIATRVVSVVALVVYAVYLGYRALYTINPDALTFSLLVYFAEVHGFFSLFFFFHALWGYRRRRVVAPPSDLRVDVFITTYNEDLDLLRQTLRAAVAMRYPHRTFILDDGRRPSVRALAAELGCEYMTRATNEHAKAGNWNNAFRQTDADVIATFDADHVPRPEFLERTLGFFRDPKVAFVQVPQEYHNLDSVQHQVRWKKRRAFGEQDAFFKLVMCGKDHWNAAFFCGTGAVLRREALAPLGGLLTDTITEDLHTSVVLHDAGWKSVYLNEVLVTGLAPADMKSFEVQRLRWAEGNLRVAGYISPLTAPGLSLHQKISYVASLYHWTIGLPKTIYYLAPPWILFSGTFPVANYDGAFIALYLSFLGCLIGSYAIVSRGRGRLLLEELYSMVSFYTLLRAMKRVVVGRRKPTKFIVTDKKGHAERTLGPVLPHVSLLAFSVLALTWSAMSLGFGVSDDRLGAGTAMFWTFYNMALMAAAVKIGMRPGEKRAAGRFRANFAVELPRDLDPDGSIGVTEDISAGGTSLLWSRELPKGTRLPLRIHFGPQVVDWLGEVVSAKGRQRDGWCRHGVRFLGLTTADVDLVHDSIFSLVVPTLFATLAEPPWAVRQWRRVKRLAGVQRKRAERSFVRVPVRIVSAAGTMVAAAHDMSATGVGVFTPRPLPVGAVVDLAIVWPGREWRGAVTVARCEARRSRHGFDRWLVGLRFVGANVPADVTWFAEQDAA